MQPSLQQEKPCDLSDDPSKYLEKFEEWYEHTSLLADSIGVKDTAQKLRLTLLWGGKEFRKFTRDAVLTAEDTLDAAITKIRAHCAKHVNLSMAVFKLMHAQPGHQVDNSIREGNRRTCYSMSIHRTPVHEGQSHERRDHFRNFR